MRENRLVESFNAAIEGFIYVLKKERNMRVHFLTALFFILLGVYFGLSSLEITALCITITMVLVAEMLNTAIELTIDIIKREIHPVARVIKDISAGAVLVTSINAIIVGYVLFSRQVPFDIGAGMAKIRQSPWHLTFLALILVFGLSILGKAIFHRGTPLRGGMPSGHAAIAFAIWTVIVFLTNNSVVVVLTFVMAFIIARHRIKSAIHSIWEIVAGSMLGILVTTLIFQIFK